MCVGVCGGMCVCIKDNLTLSSKEENLKEDFSFGCTRYIARI